jgi:FdhD protein
MVRLSDAPSTTDEAAVAEEVPVAFVYNNDSFVVVMASPADLEDLGVGFSLTEGIIATPKEIEGVEVVKHSRGIEIQMTIPASAFERLGARRRGIEARTGCGVCGIEAIDEVLKPPPAVASHFKVKAEALWRASAELESRQPMNNETRAVHAAGFASPSGELLVVREDVGRHNALDKVVGALVRANQPAGDGFLVVTSRASYELVQKSAVAGVPVLAAVSRPTSLAIQLADQAGITLVGLLRGRSANVYSHFERVVA